METLTALSSGVEVRRVALPDGGSASIRALHVAFSRATPDRLKPGTLPPTYTAKPLVSVAGDAMFGELAIVRWLERDGWRGLWVDTFHPQRFWHAMPHRSASVQPPPHVRARYDAIVAENGGRARGFFDVIAWRDAQVIHLEYKGAGDGSNRNETGWIAAALRAGVSQHDLWFVVHPRSRSAREGAG